jgi:Protein of unknown function (DUF1573)
MSSLLSYKKIIMRKIILFLLLLVGITVKAQDKKTANVIPATKTLTRVLCNKTTHDFGQITQGTPVTFVFELENQGKNSLVITDVSTPCGCTTPIFDKDKAFSTGTKAPIDVTYNAAAIGLFEKTVTVSYNNGQTMDLTIKGEVEKK